MSVIIWEKVPRAAQPKKWYFRPLLCEKADLFDPTSFPHPDPWIVVMSGHFEDAPDGYKADVDEWLAENANEYFDVSLPGEILFQSQTDALMFYLRFKS